MPELEVGRRRCAEFQRRWLGFVHRWQRVDRDDPARARGLVERCLADGLPEPAQARQPDRRAQLRCAAAVVRASGAFDAEGYAEANRLATRRVDPLQHFVDEGWRNLRAPSLEFDLWSYTCSYLDPTAEDVNPLLHYLLVGRHEGLEPVPGPPPERVPTDYDGRTPRRVCLFAAYDRDGIVDDYVVHYLRELSRFSDVFYLADGVLDPGELDKLEGVAQGAWSIPHAAYDFGSWSMLARDLVGWEVLDRYDEVVLANDSCFLVRPLDEVFAEMDGRVCDWWSLQATSMEFNEDDVGDEVSMPLDQAKHELVGPRRWSDVLYLHLSSYFQVLRRPVLDDPGFRFRLDTVCGQRTKQLVVDKYEVGISRYLMDSGFDFDTWSDALHPFHPLYSRRTFDHVAAGFPLVKRNFLAENPRDVPGFAAWPDWLQQAAPDARMDLIRASIDRVSPYDRVQRGLLAALDDATGRRVRPQPPWQGAGFRWMDEELPKFPHWWAFPVSPVTHRLDPGARALFEAVRDDPSIRKVVLTRSRRIGLDGENVTVLPLQTREGQAELARCREILIDRTPRATVDVPLSKTMHQLVHLGSGLPVAPGPLQVVRRGSNAFKDLASDYRRLNAMVVAGRADALAKAAATPLNLQQLWLTGLPRHDLVTRRQEALPVDLRQAEQELRDRLGDRRLVVLWQRPGRSPYTFSDSEREWLASWCRRQDAVLGVREGQVDRPGSLTQTLTPLGAWGLSARRVPDPSVVLRVADAVVTDGADDAVDFLLTGRPLLVLNPEEETDETAGHYAAASVLPGPVCHTFAELEAALESVFEAPGPRQAAAYERAVDLAFAHTDDLSAWRLVERIRRQYLDL